MFPRSLVFIFFVVALSSTSYAQTTTYSTQKIVTRKQQISENSIFYEKETGRRLSFEEFARIFSESARLYHSVPEIDETGKPAYYVVRKRTKEELEVGHPFMANDHKQPEIGQPLPPFVMQGVDGKTYRSEDLKGKYVLLSFWFRLSKPYVGEVQTKDLNALLETAKKRRIKLVSIGTTLNTQEECKKAMDELELGFIPIPESTGFKTRYGMFSSPSYLLIGPDGTLLALVEKQPLGQAGLEKFLVK